MRIFLPILALLILSITFQGCNSPGFNFSENDGPKADSLFLGFYLGMPQKDFFEQYYKNKYQNSETLLKQNQNKNFFNHFLIF